MSGLVPCLAALRAEFDKIAPKRARGADGWVGDAAHQRTSSDHNWDETGVVPIRDADKINEVHAIDVDADGPWPPGLGMERFVQHIVGRHRAGTDRRLRYVIYNRRIWRADHGWRQDKHTGDNQHVAHAHFSASYDSKHEADTRPWGLVTLWEGTVATVTADDWRNLIHTDGVLKTRSWMSDHGKNTNGIATKTLWERTGDEAAAAHAAADQLRKDVAELRATLEEIRAAVAALTPPPPAAGKK